MPPRISYFLLWISLFVFIWTLPTWFLKSSIKNTQYRVLDENLMPGPAMQSKTPLTLSKKASYLVEFYVDYSPGESSLFLLKPDDCVKVLRINKEKVDDPLLPFCDYVHGKTLDLSYHLKSGENLFQVIVENLGGPGSFDVLQQNTQSIELLSLMASFLLVVAFLYFLKVQFKF